jgi:hypothetical protein
MPLFSLPNWFHAVFTWDFWSGPDFDGNNGGKNLGEVQRFSSRPPWKVRASNGPKSTWRMHVVYICISVLMHFMTVQLIQFCPSLQLLQSFFQNIALKGYLTQRWMAITVSILQKNFLTTCRPWATKTFQIFTLIYHWNFLKERCMTFQGRCKTISGEVHTSSQNPTMLGNNNKG